MVQFSVARWRSENECEHHSHLAARMCTRWAIFSGERAGKMSASAGAIWRRGRWWVFDWRLFSGNAALTFYFSDRATGQATFPRSRRCWTLHFFPRLDHKLNGPKLAITFLFVRF